MVDYNTTVTIMEFKYPDVSSMFTCGELAIQIRVVLPSQEMSGQPL
jgi:hypothetical protein